VVYLIKQIGLIQLTLSDVRLCFVSMQACNKKGANFTHCWKQWVGPNTSSGGRRTRSL